MVLAASWQVCKFLSYLPFAGRKKELENYCVRLLDEHEDELTGILKEDSGDLEGILCERLAKACEPKTENPENARSEL